MGHVSDGRLSVAGRLALNTDLPAPTRVGIRLDFLNKSDFPTSLGRLGNYEVTAVVGRGGFGVVLKAFDATLHRPVAIKVLAPELACSGAARRRFTREARAAAAVVHEHVVPVYHVRPDNETDGLPYLVMAYVAGRSLQERIDGSDRSNSRNSAHRHASGVGPGAATRKA